MQKIEIGTVVAVKYPKHTAVVDGIHMARVIKVERDGSLRVMFAYLEGVRAYEEQIRLGNGPYGFIDETYKCAVQLEVASGEQIQMYHLVRDKAIKQSKLEAATNLGQMPQSWDEFYAALRQADKEWAIRYDGTIGIFSGQSTYIKTFRAAQPLITRDWSALSRVEARILLGLIDEIGGDYGLLGSMNAAGTARNVFSDATPTNVTTRRVIQDAIISLSKVPLNRSFPLMARKAYEQITSLAGFNVGVATRLLALARPEVLVSVNGESANGLAEWSGMPVATIRTSAGYEKLIRWIMSGKWWASPEPEEPLEFEREAWAYRAALIDGLIYGRN